MNYAIILLAGEGKRMHSPIPKQFLRVRNVPVFIYTAKAFDSHPEIDGVLLVVHPDYLDDVSSIIKTFNLAKVKAIVAGGATRQMSVFNGLDALLSFAQPNDIVLIHDAARPLVSSRIITDNILATLSHGAAETVLETSDTLTFSSNGILLESPLNRSHVYQVQTPQSFSYQLIHDAHLDMAKQKNHSLTDDAQAVHQMGAPVYLVRGDRFNFKITTPEDFALFEAWVEKQGRDTDD